MGYQNAFITHSEEGSSYPWCPLVDLFLRGVAKLENLQDEVSYILVLHLEVSVMSMVGFSLVSLDISPILLSHEATFKNVADD